MIINRVYGRVWSDPWIDSASSHHNFHSGFRFRNPDGITIPENATWHMVHIILQKSNIILASSSSGPVSTIDKAAWRHRFRSRPIGIPRKRENIREARIKMPLPVFKVEEDEKSTECLRISPKKGHPLEILIYPSSEACPFPSDDLMGKHIFRYSLSANPEEISQVYTYEGTVRADSKAKRRARLDELLIEYATRIINIRHPANCTCNDCRGSDATGAASAATFDGADENPGPVGTAPTHLTMPIIETPRFEFEDEHIRWLTAVMEESSEEEKDKLLKDFGRGMAEMFVLLHEDGYYEEGEEDDDEEMQWIPVISAHLGDLAMFDFSGGEWIPRRWRDEEWEAWCDLLCKGRYDELMVYALHNDRTRGSLRQRSKYPLSAMEALWAWRDARQPN